MPRLRICQVTSELAPLAKTGGLGDVVAALAPFLHRQGHDVKVILPLYRRIEMEEEGFEPVEDIRDVGLRMGSRRYVFSVLRLPERYPWLYLIRCPALYDRPDLYSPEPDEPLRFAVLARAAIEICQRLAWAPDVFHLHDWHTGLLPLYLKSIYAWDRLFERSKTLLTIHNIGYQGVYPREIVGDLELVEASGMLHQEDLAAGRVNFLKTGILYADLLSTVSPTHAEEIQTDEYGMRLDGLLRARSDHLVGILNGVDYSVWNPESDPLVPFHYSAEDLSGKEENKSALLSELALPYREGLPLLGIVSRLSYQKGFELLFEPLPELLGAGLGQLVALGSGEARYEEFFTGLQRRFPDRVVFYRGFHDALAHRIEAAADLFLMPSRYEPCGLNQMYSLRYGTPPVVRKTGGLADSVRPWQPETGDGTGFVFEHFTADGVRWALSRALETYRDRDAWRRLQRNAMAEDFSWDRQGMEYVSIYQHLARE